MVWGPDPPSGTHGHGSMLWFTWKTLLGSQVRLSAFEARQLLVAVDAAGHVGTGGGDAVGVAPQDDVRARPPPSASRVQARHACFSPRFVHGMSALRSKAAARPAYAVASSGTRAMALPGAAATSNPASGGRHQLDQGYRVPLDSAPGRWRRGDMSVGPNRGRGHGRPGRRGRPGCRSSRRWASAQRAGPRYPAPHPQARPLWLKADEHDGLAGERLGRVRRGARAVDGLEDGRHGVWGRSGRSPSNTAQTSLAWLAGYMRMPRWRPGPNG